MTSKPGRVYLIHISKNIYKVGLTSDLWRRFRTLAAQQIITYSQPLIYSDAAIAEACALLFCRKRFKRVKSKHEYFYMPELDSVKKFIKAI